MSTLLDCTDLVELLERRAQASPALPIFGDACTSPTMQTIDAAALCHRARTVAGRLEQVVAVGARVLVPCPSTLEAIISFWGVLFAGAIAVPVPAPRRRHDIRLEAIVEACRPALMIGTAAEQPKPTAGRQLNAVPFLDITDIPDEEVVARRKVAADGAAVAFLQYTSGSTGRPKGVRVTHANLLSNAQRMHEVFALDEDSRCVSWLPLYHDLGLIAAMLQPVYSGYQTLFFPPAAFVERPLTWLEAVSHSHATVSGGPNFGFELAARALESHPAEPALDLSRWRVAFCGAEPIRPATMDRFVRATQPYGFRTSALRPCYGLAEATLLVSAGRWERDNIATPRVGLGPPLAGLDVAIVDPDTLTPVPDGGSGEVWIAGNTVADGYWDAPEATSASFAATSPALGTQRYLRTGDIGAMRDHELYIFDRLKDLIILRGSNYYASDIEQAVESSHPSLRTHGCAAVGILVDQEEQLVVLAEAERGRALGEIDEIGRRAQQALARQFQIKAHDIVIVRQASLPRTSSGKIQRHACREAYRAGELQMIGRAVQASHHARSEASETTAQESTHDRVRSLIADAMALRRDDIPLDEDVGSLGMDSLTVFRVKMAIERLSGVDLPYSRLLETTVEDLAALVASSTLVSPPLARDAARVEVLDAPLSVGQRALLFMDDLRPQQNAYSIVRAMRVHGALNLEALREALGVLAARHNALRMRVTFAADEPAQDFRGEIACELHDALDWPAERLRAEADRLAHTPFDVRHGPLVAVDIYRRSAVEHLLVFRAHHLAVDLWSLLLVLTELEALYGERRGSGRPAVRPRATQYSDYVVQQRTLLTGDAGERLVQFWYERLKDFPQTLELSVARPSNASGHGSGKHAFRVDAARAGSLKRVAADQRTTLHALLLAAFEIVLSRYSGQDRFLVGTLAGGRTRETFSGLVGYCVNLLALRANVDDRLRFDEFLRLTRDELSSALDHQDAPFSLVVERLRPERQLDRSPLIRAVCVTQPASILPGRDLASLVLNRPGDRLSFDDLQLEPIEIAEGGAQFDLCLAVADRPDGLEAVLQFDTTKLEPSDAESMAACLQTVLAGIAENPVREIRALPVVDAAEFGRRSAARNDTARAFDDTHTVHETIAACAARLPMAPVVIHRSTAWTYADLMDRVHACAAALRRLDVRAGERVGVCVERSPEMLVALLAVLESGAAYVPLDPDHPRERLERIVSDAAPRAVIVSQRTAAQMASAAAPRLSIETLVASQDQGVDAARPKATVLPHDAAYVMYTSGSTGLPKGVVVSHRNVMNLFAGLDDKVGCGADDTLIAVTSVAFDISVVELLWTLARGARVVIADAPRSTSSARHRTCPARAPAVSLFYFADAGATDRSSTYSLLLEGARYADRHDFAAVWTPERHFHPFGGLYPNPSVTSAALASITERVHLRAGSVVLPLHHPMRVAEEWSVVDNLSGGRVGVAFASGWHAEDFALAPADYAARRTVMFERIEAVRTLWRGEALAAQDGNGRACSVRLFPRPVQRDLPIWLTAAGNPETFTGAAAIAANVLTHLLGQDLEEVRQKLGLYARALADRQRSRDAFTVTLMLHAFIDDTQDRVIAHALGPLTHYLRSSVDLMARLVKTMRVDLDIDRMAPKDLDDLVAFAAERYLQTSGLFGTPAACAEMLDRLVDIGVDEVACLVDFGIAHDATMASLARIAETRDRLLRACEPVDDSIHALARRTRATMIQCTPSMLAMLLKTEPIAPAFGAMRAVMLGGEPIPAGLVTALGPAAHCLNMYGPTETTVWSAIKPLSYDDDLVTIGGPIANTQLYVLDAALRPLPDGVTGEVWIGGEGVARGYWRRPGATAERFVADPYSSRPGARLYRTGDLGRHLRDGTIELLGRTDQQIKIRGYRVELGEIEAALNAQADVRTAVVVRHRDEQRGDELIAYVVPEDAPHGFDPEATRRSLLATLPAYMVPAAVIVVDTFPLNANSKVDRRCLADSPVSRPLRPKTPAVEPQGELERAVRGIWQQVLGIADVSVDDNFFEIGGHSLLLAQVHQRLQTALDRTLPLIALIEHPTIRSLAAFLQAGRVQLPDHVGERARERRRALLAQRPMTRSVSGPPA